MRKKISVFTDGGSRGNPGPAAYGFVIYSDKALLFARGQTIGTATNNVAEYSGILEALSWLFANRESLGDISGIDFFMDSLLACHQLNGVYKVKKAHLGEFLQKIREMGKKFAVPVTFSHIPREENKAADRMVNEALDNS